MSAAPDTSLGRRSIGEILLEHGYVTKEQVDEATAIHEESGRPLGQILVEAGSITRLELASALAEQWSDAATPLAQPLGAPLADGAPLELAQPAAHVAPTAPAADHEELRSRIAAVEEALEKLAEQDEADAAGVAEAIQKVADRLGQEVSQRLADVEPRLEELGERIRALASEGDGRLERLTTLVGELNERVAVVDESLAAAAARSDQVAGDAATALSALKQELASLTDRVSGLADGREVADLRAALGELADRPLRDHELAAQVEALAAVVSELRGRRDVELVQQVEVLAETVEDLSERRDTELAAQVEGLVEDVARLDARRDAALVAQVETLAALVTELGDRVDSISASSGDADALQQLHAKLAELAQRPLGNPDLDQRVDDLAAYVAELAERPAADPDADRRLAELGSALSELGETVAALAARPAGDPALDERLWELAARLEQLERGESNDELRGQLAALEQRVDAQEDLHRRLDELQERPAGDPSLGARIHELEQKVAAVPDDSVLEELEAGDRSLGFRIDGVVARVDELATSLERLAGADVSREAWEQALAALHSRLDDTADVGTRVGELEERVAQVESAPQQAAPAPAPDPQLHQQLKALSARVDQLASAVASGAVAAEGEGGEVVPVAPSPALERDVEHVLMAIERLSVHLGAHERALTELMGARGVVAQVQELSARVSDIETYGISSGSAEGGGGGDGGGGLEMRSEMRALMRRLEDAETAQQNDRERLMQQLEKAAGAIDWRLQRLESSRHDDADA